MQGKLVSTAPVEYSGMRVDGHNIQNGAHKEAKNVMVTGYLICKAESADDLTEWSQSCPILRYPNSSVEIRPLISFPI